MAHNLASASAPPKSYMPVESRNKMISFRLSEEEYDRFRDLCFTRGIRSVSELARTAINMLLQQPDRAPHESLESRVADIEGRVHMLALELKRLHQHVAIHPSAMSASAGASALTE